MHSESFYSFICQPENFIYLDRQNFLYPITQSIVMSFVQENATNFQDLKKYFKKYFNNYQYIYSILFPVFYMANQERGTDIKAFYLLHVKEWSDKKNAGKNLAVSTEREEINEFEQKPVEIDDFKTEENGKVAEERRKKKKYNEKTELDRAGAKEKRILRKKLN